MTMMGAVDVPLGTFKGSDYNTTVELWGEGAMGFPAKPKPE